MRDIAGDVINFLKSLPKYSSVLLYRALGPSPYVGMEKSEQGHYVKLDDAYDALRSKFPAQEEGMVCVNCGKELIGIAYCGECNALPSIGRPAPDPSKLPRRCKVCLSEYGPGAYLEQMVRRGCHSHYDGGVDIACTGELEPYERRK